MLFRSAIFRSENVAHRQAATLRSADVITFACASPRAPESAASSTVQVVVLLHSSTHIRRTTLEAWLDPARNPQIEKFEWSAIQTGKGHPYSRDPTVQQFLEGSALDLPVAGKRLLIDLAGPSGHSPKKCGRKTQPTPPTLQDPPRARDPRPRQTRSLAPRRASGPPRPERRGAGQSPANMLSPANVTF